MIDLMIQMDNTSQRPSVRTEKYGPLDDQIGDLYIPARPRPPVICLLHGGFWLKPYRRDQMSAMAEDLAERGFAVWNLEYRRLPDGVWPQPLDDLAAGLEYLSHLAGEAKLDLSRLVVIGHSAGGQLALLSATINREGGMKHAANKIRVAAVVGQAPIADLIHAHDLGIGDNAVADFLNGTPQECYLQYQQASPMARLPLGIPQLLLHGTADDVIPIKLSRAYTKAARNSGDQVELIELPGLGHMDYLDPSSAAHAALCSWLIQLI